MNRPFKENIGGLFPIWEITSADQARVDLPHLGHLHRAWLAADQGVLNTLDGAHDDSRCVFHGALG